MGDGKGKLTEKLGQWTNDRTTEAKGRAEQEAPDGEVTEEALDEEVDEVRREHGDIVER